MWLPKPIYRALPIMYALMGVLFIMGASYLGISDPTGPMYLGLGALSIVASITVTYWRTKYPGGRLRETMRLRAAKNASRAEDSAD